METQSSQSVEMKRTQTRMHRTVENRHNSHISEEEALLGDDSAARGCTSHHSCLRSVAVLVREVAFRTADFLRADVMLRSDLLKFGRLMR